MYRNILVPLDGSKLAEGALPYAQEIAQQSDANVFLLQVMQPVNIPTYYLQAYDVIQEAHEEVYKSTENYLKTLAETFEDDALTVKTEVIRGIPQKEILAYVDQNKIDLIVLTARGQSDITRWLIGNVANKILKGAKIPVLLIRPSAH
jgi:nucleotide-binding universal stress UspA family protein